MKGLYKLGFSKNPEARLKEHSKTSVAERYQCILAYPVRDMKRAERTVFSILDDYRYAGNREFFSCPLDLIVRVCNDVQGHINMDRPLRSSYLTEEMLDKITDRYSNFGDLHE